MIDDDIGTGCNQGGDEDDHDSADVAIITVETPELDLIKSLAPGQSGSVSVGETVNFIITVRNNSNVEIKDQKVIDQYPVGLTPADDNWKPVAGKDNLLQYKDLITLAPNAEVKLPIAFKVAENAPENMVNTAVVCDEDDTDCKPEPPTDCDDDAESGDPDGCEPITTKNPSIKIDKTDANSDDQDGSTGNDSQTVDS